MSVLEKQLEKLRAFWRGLLGTGANAETCMVLSVILLSVLYLLALPLLVPWSVARSFK